MGSWDAWRDLSPLVEVAQGHASATAVTAMGKASELLRQGKAKSADRVLAAAASGEGRRWIAVARADIAALHFTLCIRGIAWRLTDGETPSPTDRAVDFSEDTRIEPGDVSVEALLTNVDDAMQSDVPALVTQARIARARVAAFTQRCAANEDVAQRAQQSVEADLATLAAESHLTPDLAYMWAGVQMNRFSGSAARPFLLQAREGGFDHPAVTFMLSVIALEQRDLDSADELAQASVKRYAELGDTGNVAEAWFVRGEIARARKDAAAARKHYDLALKSNAQHVPAMLAIAVLAEANEIGAGVTYLRGPLQTLLLGNVPLNSENSRDAGANLEGLVMTATEVATVQLVRDTFLEDIDDEPDGMKRGLRYFFAATMDARLREYDSAYGHGVLAKDEFASTEFGSPVDIEAFLRRIAP